jgi:hypothetical protein
LNRSGSAGVRIRDFWIFKNPKFISAVLLLELPRVMRHDPHQFPVLMPFHRADFRQGEIARSPLAAPAHAEITQNRKTRQPFRAMPSKMLSQDSPRTPDRQILNQMENGALHRENRRIFDPLTSIFEPL